MAAGDLIDDREALVCSATGGGIPVKRMAHFLKAVPAIDAASRCFKLPILPEKCSWGWSMSVYFNGWRDPQTRWFRWVNKMQVKHQDVWKKAGVFDAIQFSRYTFQRNDDLLYNFTERWNSDTNTFVFPWGEATMTLEDISILGGLPVQGSCAFTPVSGAELVAVEGRLKQIPDALRSHQQWLDHFMNSGSPIEHLAFLCLWISRFVFSGNEFDRVGDHVFPVAISLSRGVQVALAPAVLANVYRDLGVLYGTMAAAYAVREAELKARAENPDLVLDPLSTSVVSLWAPLQFVQLWVWERFLVFRPQPKFLKSGEIRAARWHRLGRQACGNVRPIINNCGDIFLWRPYCMAVDEWSFPRVYKEQEGWFLLRKSGRFLDVELEAYARCLRTSILVGTDGNEPYQPHRVALQFGLDQDIPAFIPRKAESAADAWDDYRMAFSRDFSLYLPARPFEGDLSVEYRKWWNGSVVVPLQPFPGVVRGPRASTVCCFQVHASRQERLNCVVCSRLRPSKVAEPVERYDSYVPPGFARKSFEDPPIPARMFGPPVRESSSGCPPPALKRIKRKMEVGESSSGRPPIL